MTLCATQDTYLPYLSTYTLSIEVCPRCELRLFILCSTSLGSAPIAIETLHCTAVPNCSSERYYFEGLNEWKLEGTSPETWTFSLKCATGCWSLAQTLLQGCGQSYLMVQQWLNRQSSTEMCLNGHVMSYQKEWKSCHRILCYLTFWTSLLSWKQNYFAVLTLLHAYEGSHFISTCLSL